MDTQINFLYYLNMNALDLLNEKEKILSQRLKDLTLLQMADIYGCISYVLNSNVFYNHYLNL